MFVCLFVLLNLIHTEGEVSFSAGNVIKHIAARWSDWHHDRRRGGFFQLVSDKVGAIFLELFPEEAVNQFFNNQTW